MTEGQGKASRELHRKRMTNKSYPIPSGRRFFPSESAGTIAGDIWDGQQLEYGGASPASSVVEEAGAQFSALHEVTSGGTACTRSCVPATPTRAIKPYTATVTTTSDTRGNIGGDSFQVDIENAA